VIIKKLTQEVQNRDWDHVFYVIMEDLQDEKGIDICLPSAKINYVVSEFHNNSVSVSITVLGRNLGASFYVSINSLISKVGCFNKDGELHGYSLQTDETLNFFGVSPNQTRTFDIKRIESLFKNGIEENRF